VSTLITETLIPGYTFDQPIKVIRSISVAHIRPWILINGTLADGDFQCRVLQGGTELAVATMNYTLINAAKTQDYAHGYIRFDFESLILNRAQGEESTEYVLEFSMINHTLDVSNYISIVREWDSKSAIVYGDVDGNGDAVNSIIEPNGYQIFEYRS